MKILKFVACFTFVFITLFLCQPVLAESSATVKATVQSELVSVTTDVSSLNYGFVAYGGFKKLNDVVTVTNTGNVQINVELSGGNAVEKTDSSKIWELTAGTPENNKFRHGVGTDGTNYTWLTVGGKNTIPALNNVNSAVAVSGVDLVFYAPLAGSVSGTFDTNVYFTAVKAT